MADLAELTRRFRAQGDTMARRAPFTASVSAAIADDPETVALLLTAPEEQQLPVLLLAALHHQVLTDPGCELAQWYPTVAAAPRTDDVASAVIRHCRIHAGGLRGIVATRSTQTNEVGRCALFVPALGLVADEMGPLGLVDVGTSGGLNLQLDRYRYRYEPGGTVGVASPVVLTAGTRGAVPVPRSLPTVAARIGLDREPVDVADPEAARWLTACVWPDQADRFHRLESAIAIAREHPPPIRTGDAVDDLAAVVDAVRAAGHPVVLNSWVLNYLPAERRTAYVAELDRIGERDDLTWVFAEAPSQCPGLPFPERIADQHTTALMMARWRDGRKTVDHLAVTHPHGYWLHWTT